MVIIFCAHVQKIRSAIKAVGFTKQYQFLSNFVNMTSTPTRTCLKRDVLLLKGTSFSQWVQDPNHLYIDRNLAKYTNKNDLPDSIWYKDISELQKFVNTNEEEIDLCTAYERCIRQTPELWDKLEDLENKVLGCWCKPSYPCHADVLIKLYKEKYES